MIATRHAPHLLRTLRSGETGCAHAAMKALFQLAAATLLPRDAETRPETGEARCPQADRCRFRGCDGSCRPPPRAA